MRFLAWAALLLGLRQLFQDHAWPACAAIVVWLVLLNQHKRGEASPKNPNAHNRAGTPRPDFTLTTGQ